MKYALITLSIPADSQRTRDILQFTDAPARAWCERHDIDFIRVHDIGDFLVPGVPYCEKFKLLQYLDEYDRIIYMDDTCLIAPNCPNLFEIVPEDKLGCVTESVDLFPDRANHLKKVLELYDVQTSNQKYFNAGMLVFSQVHRVLFEQAATYQDSFKEDQDFFNAMINKFELPILDLGLSYNYLGSQIRNLKDEQLGSREIFIYHLTRGCNGVKGRQKFARKIVQNLTRIESCTERNLKLFEASPEQGFSEVQLAHILRDIAQIKGCRLLILGACPNNDVWQEANKQGDTCVYENVAQVVKTGTRNCLAPVFVGGTDWDMVVVVPPIQNDGRAGHIYLPDMWVSELLQVNPKLVVYFAGYSRLITNQQIMNRPGVLISGDQKLLKLDHAYGPVVKIPRARLNFMFVVREDLNQQGLWEQFFADADPELYDCLYYSISGENKPDIPNTVKFDNTLHPQYGHYTYVQVVLRMLEQGMKNELSQKFILLSESCIPLSSFNAIYREVMADEKSYLFHFNVGTGEEKEITEQTRTEFSDWIKRGGKQVWIENQYFFNWSSIKNNNERYVAISNKEGIQRAAFPKFMAQGICFHRSLAKLLLDTRDDLDDYQKVEFIEEHYYLLPLIRRNIPVDDFVERRNLMSVIWRGSKPRLYAGRSEQDTLSEELIDDKRAQGYFLLRKVADTVDLSEELKTHILQRPRLGNGLILTYCSGYGREIYQRFVGTLFETGFGGKLVIFLQPKDLDTAEFLKAEYGERVSLIVTLPNLHGKYARYGLYLDFLKQDRDLRSDDPVFLCDSRDVIFQKDIFQYLPWPDADLIVFAENAKIGECKWNTLWMKRFGDDAFAKNKDKQILCSGILLGRKAAVMKYLEGMLTLISEKVGLENVGIDGEFTGGDQGVFNYLMYSDRLSQLNIHRMQWTDPMVVTIHHMQVQIDDEGSVVDENGNIFWCVHQFDRLPKADCEKLNNLSLEYDLSTRFGSK